VAALRRSRPELFVPLDQRVIRPVTPTRVAIPTEARRAKESGRVAAHATIRRSPITVNAELSGKDVELWSFYDAIRCPTLLRRGEQSTF